MGVSADDHKRACLFLKKGIASKQVAAELQVQHSKVLSVRKKLKGRAKNSASSSIALQPSSCRMERIRLRMLISMIQSGGKRRTQALWRIRENRDHRYVKYVLSGRHAEHGCRALDRSSRRVLLHLWDHAPAASACAHFVVALIAIVRICLVDNGPIRKFFEALQRGIVMAEVAAELIHELGESRPRAYKPFGRGESNEKYYERRLATLENICRFLSERPKISYTPAFFQRLVTLREDDGQAQFSIMQICMDLLLSPHEGQRKAMQKNQKLFYVAGPGEYAEVAKKNELCEKWAYAMHRNSQMRDIRCGFNLRLHRFFDYEHSFCGDRKYEKIKYLM